MAEADVASGAMRDQRENVGGLAKIVHMLLYRLKTSNIVVRFS
jgi:hypothetical protein